LSDWPQTADLSIDLDHLAGQGLKSAKPGDLAFRLADRGKRGQTLREGLAVDLSCDLKVRAMPRIVRFGAMAAGITATVKRAGNGARLEVTEFGDLPKQGGALAGKCIERVGHKVSPCFKYFILEYLGAKKRPPAIDHF
jgi:hypothetical protein